MDADERMEGAMHYTPASHQLVSHEDTAAEEMEYALMSPRVRALDELQRLIEEDKAKCRPLSPETWRLFNLLCLEGKDS